MYSVVDMIHDAADMLHGVTDTMCDAAKIMHGVADMMAEGCAVVKSIPEQQFWDLSQSISSGIYPRALVLGSIPEH